MYIEKRREWVKKYIHREKKEVGKKSLITLHIVKRRGWVKKALITTNEKNGVGKKSAYHYVHRKEEDQKIYIKL